MQKNKNAKTIQMSDPQLKQLIKNELTKQIAEDVKEDVAHDITPTYFNPTEIIQLMDYILLHVQMSLVVDDDHGYHSYSSVERLGLLITGSVSVQLINGL